jgi:hypothetical protein
MTDTLVQTTGAGLAHRLLTALSATAAASRLPIANESDPTQDVPG